MKFTLREIVNEIQQMVKNNEWMKGGPGSRLSNKGVLMWFWAESTEIYGLSHIAMKFTLTEIAYQLLKMEEIH